MRDGTLEADLLERAREGDRGAFDGLVRLHFARVYALLFRMVGNHEDAEDLAQECFVKAQCSLRWFRGEAAFSTWLYRIALSTSRDHFRASGRRARSESLVDESTAPPSRAGGPREEVARHELMAGLRSSLERLPHRLRAALVMRTHEEMEYEEVAEVLGITVGTARTHVMKARRLLERWMKPWIGEEGS